MHIINKGSTANPFVICALRELLWLSAIYNFRFTAIHIPSKSNVLADALLHLHPPAQCISFYHHLLSLIPQMHLDTSPLINHMSDISANFLHCRFSGPLPGQTAEGGEYTKVYIKVSTPVSSLGVCRSFIFEIYLLSFSNPTGDVTE